jgi:hypothetical protein
MKDYIELSDGTQVRIEANWNAIAEFAENEGITDLSKLDQLGKMKPSQYPRLIYACAKEGERMDGREFDMPLQDFKALLRFQQVGDFNELYKKQALPDTAKKKGRKNAKTE